MVLRYQLLILVVLGLLAGCRGDMTRASEPRPRTLTVFAAASLTDSFGEIGRAFEAQNQQVEVIFNFAGSQTLRSQIEQGAVADIFASANQTHMAALVAANLVETPVIFSENQLVVIVPEANPAAVNTLSDLTKADLKLVLAGPVVPVGRYAREVLANLDRDPELGLDFSERVLANLVSEEENVKAVLAKVQLGEADAGIVYASDVGPANDGQLMQLAIPSQFNVVAEYPLALLSGSSESRLAQAFVDFVLSPQGQKILMNHGFRSILAEPVSYHRAGGCKQDMSCD